MRILSRYVLKQHAVPFVFALSATTAIMLLNQIAKRLGDLVGKGLSSSVIVEVFVLSIPLIIALTLPMAVLVAVLYTFSQFAAENEINALKASGIDLRRMVLPLLIAAAGIAGGMVWFNDQVLPASNYRWRMLMMDVAQTSPLLGFKEQVVNPIPAPGGSSSFYLQAGRIFPGSSRMRDVAIYDVSSPEISRTIYADSAFVAMNEAKTDLVLTLFNGHVREVDTAMPETFQRIAFERQVLRIAGVSQKLERTTESSFRTDRDMTVGMMLAEIDTFRAELRALEANPDTAAAAREVKTGMASMHREAGYDEARERSLRYSIREYEVEIHKKYAIATATLVFVLIGVPLALRFPRGGIGMVIGASLLIFSIYYVGLIGGSRLHRPRRLAPSERYPEPPWHLAPSAPASRRLLPSHLP